VKHHAALPYEDLSAFLVSLRAQEGIAARALEFTILTAARTSEALSLRPEEIDGAAAMWTVPAGRMKGKRVHRVPLSARALEIVREMRLEHPGRPFVSPRGVASRCRTWRFWRRSAAWAAATSPCTDFAARSTTGHRSAPSYPKEVIEMALAHAIEDKTEAAFRRGDLLEKRRRLISAWADFAAGQDHVQ
jgi:integrase